MKKIINGRRYDTETAKSVAYWTNRKYGNFEYCEETLYQKKTGEYFLHGKGGAKSQYSKQIEQHTFSDGEALIPMTYEEARKWAEESIDADDYEKLFGAVVEDDTKRFVTLSLPVSVVEKIKRQAAESGKGMSEIVSDKFAD